MMEMVNEKIENLLVLALEATEEELEQSPELASGVQLEENRWEVIIRYFGELDQMKSEHPIWNFYELLGGYAVLTLPRQDIELLAGYDQVTYIEKPKPLYFETAQGKQVSCIMQVQNSAAVSGNLLNLTGAGVLVGIIDSGIDYRHPDFCNEDGSSRIAALLDLSTGIEYTREQITEAIRETDEQAARQLVPVTDVSGHGTHVAGIAAGNGRASGGRNRGVAYESDLLVVKLGVPGGSALAKTSELMRGIDYCVRKAAELNQPLALNISYGNNYGSHSGTSLIETYLNEVSGYWKTSIVVGSGNEAVRRIHTSGVLEEMPQNIMLAAGAFESSLNLQLWKNYADSFRIQIINPAGDRREVIASIQGTNRVRMGNTTLLIFYGEPSPYSPYQEIYIEFLPDDLSGGSYIDEGIWQILLFPERIIDGEYHLWLPAGGVNQQTTGFLRSTPDVTLTIPSTAAGVVTVGAYDAYRDVPAAFSGRGYTRVLRAVKPDLAAPGVDIVSCAPGGGYTTRTGTSMATPFVTGAAALLMQWGITDGNDPFLYGEKIRAYLIKGARQLAALPVYPNPQLGWGALCVRDSLPR